MIKRNQDRFPSLHGSGHQEYLHAGDIECGVQVSDEDHEVIACSGSNQAVYFKLNQCLMQATLWPGAISFSSGVIREHSLSATGHLEARRQPDGGSMGELISPTSRSLWSFLARPGIEVSKALV